MEAFIIRAGCEAQARDSVNRNYATVGTDTGHESQPGYLGSWARDNVEAQLDFGYLAVHRTSEVSKALLRAYYRADPAYSYFIGCSRGGGQAMMETQRYPNDFDGVVAGAPAFNWTGFAATSVAIAKALYPDPAHLDPTVLDRNALLKLRQAILDQCDEQDGLKDGIIADPPSAHFGASEVDWLSVIVDWVEHAKPPDRLIASKHENGKPVMTRPLYPYPRVAIYKGSGDPNSADSFEAKSAKEH